MPDTRIIAELTAIWDRADADTKWAMVQWTKEREQKIDWPLFPELISAYAASKKQVAGEEALEVG